MKSICGQIRWMGSKQSVEVRSGDEVVRSGDLIDDCVQTFDLLVKAGQLVKRRVRKMGKNRHTSGRRDACHQLLKVVMEGGWRHHAQSVIGSPSQQPIVH